MRRISPILVLSLVLAALAACAAGTPAQAPTTVPTTTLTAAPTTAPTTVPTAPPRATPDLAALGTTVVAGLPPTLTPETAGDQAFLGIGTVATFSLTSTIGSAPLAAVYSTGFRAAEPPQNHFVAVYAAAPGGWRQLARIDLENPDLLDETMVRQVSVTPDKIWIEVQGAAGAHSGCYDLLSFDGTALVEQLGSCNSTFGSSRLEDLDGNGTPEALIDASDYYVYCYACGVVAWNTTVYRWDGSAFAEQKLSQLPADAPQALRDRTDALNRLVLAERYKEAAQLADALVADAPGDPQVRWNARLVHVVADARAEQVGGKIYPLVEKLLYGDYPAALDVMRQYTPQQLFDPSGPLFAEESVASGWQFETTSRVTTTAELALAQEPTFAPALFLRAWAEQIATPGAPSVIIDIERAAALAPDEKLYSSSLAYLRRR